MSPWGHRAIFVLALGAIALAGCGAGVVVLMKNPQTGQVIECRPVGDGLAAATWSHQVKQCASALERDGWLRLTPR